MKKAFGEYQRLFQCLTNLTTDYQAQFPLFVVRFTEINVGWFLFYLHLNIFVIVNIEQICYTKHITNIGMLIRG